MAKAVSIGAWWTSRISHAKVATGSGGAGCKPLYPCVTETAERGGLHREQSPDAMFLIPDGSKFKTQQIPETGLLCSEAIKPSGSMAKYLILMYLLTKKLPYQ